MSSRSIPAKDDPRNRAWGMTVADVSFHAVAGLTSNDSDSNVECSRGDKGLISASGYLTPLMKLTLEGTKPKNTSGQTGLMR